MNPSTTTTPTRWFTGPGGIDPRKTQLTDLPQAVSGFLPNRFKYILHADTSHPVLCLQLFVRVGSAWETDREAGYSHFMEHLAFKSTRAFGYNEITQFVNSLGGSINAYTDSDCTCYYLLLPSEYLAEGLKVLSELALHPSFTREDLAMEKDIIIEEMEQNKNDPESDFLDYIQACAFQDNPLRRPVLGTPKSVKAAKLADMQAFHRKYYQPCNSFLVAVGDLKPGIAAENIAACFGPWNAASGLQAVCEGSFREPEFPPRPQVWRQNKQDFLAWVLPELCDAHPQSDALLIALRWLAVGRSSRLYKRLVEETKLASSVKVSSFSGVMSGVSAIVVSPMRPSRVTRIQAIFKQELQDLLAGKIDPGELDLVKKDIINTWRYGFDGVENLAGMIGAEEFISGYEQLYLYDRQIEPLGMPEVLEAARKYWQPNRLQIVHQSLQSMDLSLPELPPVKPARTAGHAALPSPLGPVHRCAVAKPRLEALSDGYYSATLPNGLKFLYRHQPRRPVSGFALATNVCQLSENPEQRGLNYLCSAAMLHSSKTRGHAELLRISREHGISLQVEHQTDATVFLGKCFHSAMPTALSLLSEIFCQPAFEPGNIRLLKSSSIDLLRRDNQNPASLAWLSWSRMLLGSNSVYGRYSGRITDLAKHSRDDVCAWHRAWYQPQRCTLVCVSSEDPRTVLECATALFAGATLSEPPQMPVPPPPQPSRVRLRRQKLDSGQAIIHLGGFAAPAQDRKATTAMHILAQIIGGDMDSRLFNLIREKYGYAYQTGFEFSSTKDFGYWFAYAYCDPDDRKPCLKLMREVLAEVCDKGLSATELLHAQNHLCGMNRFETESASLQAVLVASLSALGYEPNFHLSREKRIRSVSLDDLNQVAARWLQNSNQWTHILI